MQECEKAGIMVDFIQEYGSEVNNMLFTQFNWDDALEVAGQEYYEEGMAVTRKIFKLYMQGKTADEIASECGLALEKVQEILE